MLMATGMCWERTLASPFLRTLASARTVSHLSQLFHGLGGLWQWCQVGRLMPEDMADPQAWCHIREGGCPNEGGFLQHAGFIIVYLCANKAIASGLCKALLLGLSVPVAQNPPGAHG